MGCYFLDQIECVKKIQKKKANTKKTTNNKKKLKIIKKLKYQKKKKIEKLETEFNELAPNMKAIDQYALVKKQYDNKYDEQKNKKESYRSSEEIFKEISEKRKETFLKAFEIIRKNIRPIYRDLTRRYVRDESGKPIPNTYNEGQALLDLDDYNDPFNSTIVYSAMPPLKPFREMSQLSGGEKSVASLALLFAVHSYKQSPFFVLDEVDAALDATNVAKVSDYIRYYHFFIFYFFAILFYFYVLGIEICCYYCLFFVLFFCDKMLFLCNLFQNIFFFKIIKNKCFEKTKSDKQLTKKYYKNQRKRAERDGLQTIVISLKDRFFQKAEALIGVCKDRASESSMTLQIDLSQYRQKP